MLLLLACTPAPLDTADTAVDPGPVEPLFSFVVFADPHVTADDEHADRLRTAVQWVNDNAEAEGIELLFIVGDIGWGDVGVDLASELLGALSIPWVPVLGDNEVQYGSEERFDAVFSLQYAALAEQFEGFDRAATPVDNPDYGTQSWFQDFGFDHRGLRLVGVDWNSRHIGGLEGEMADLHDFEGGSWEWLASDLEQHGEGASDSVVFFSHHPMHLSPGAFDLEEIDLLDGLLAAYDDALYANFAGHYHVNGDEADPARPIEVHVTDAIWDDTLTLRQVDVTGNAAVTEYAHALVELPYD